MVRFEIQLIEATGLPAADFGGTSDPYVEVCTNTERQKTQIIKKTLSPVWRETKTVSIVDPMKDAVGFLVFDWDRMSANEIIAYGYISLFNVPINGVPLDLWIDLYKKGGKKDKKKEKKDQKKADKTGRPPKPPTPGGRLHIIIRNLDAQPMPAQPMPAQPMPGQPMPAQPMPGQPMPGQPMPGQPMPGQPMPGQPMPGQPMPAQPMPGQPMPGQPMPGQPMPGQPYYPPQPMPGQPMPMPMPGQPMLPANPLQIQNPYTGVCPQGFQIKSGYLRPKKTGAEVAGHAAGKGAKKTLKAIGHILF